MTVIYIYMLYDTLETPASASSFSGLINKPQIMSQKRQKIQAKRQRICWYHVMGQESLVLKRSWKYWPKFTTGWAEN